MSQLIFVTHPEVQIDPAIPVQNWALNEQGRIRARHFAASPVLQGVTQLWSSAERKAQETAAILAHHLDVKVLTHARLGENDRSATGFLPPPVFEAAADAFFAQPDQSYAGWETARAAQRRIVDTVAEIAKNASGGDLAIVAHGAVGTLLYCYLTGSEIDRRFDQPSQGHYWTARLPGLVPDCCWHPIA